MASETWNTLRINSPIARLRKHCGAAELHSPERAADRARATRRHTFPLARSDIPTACKGRGLVLPLQPREGGAKVGTAEFFSKQTHRLQTG